MLLSATPRYADNPICSGATLHLVRSACNTIIRRRCVCAACSTAFEFYRPTPWRENATSTTVALVVALPNVVAAGSWSIPPTRPSSTPCAAETACRSPADDVAGAGRISHSRTVMTTARGAQRADPGCTDNERPRGCIWGVVAERWDFRATQQQTAPPIGGDALSNASGDFSG